MAKQNRAGLRSLIAPQPVETQPSAAPEPAQPIYQLSTTAQPDELSAEAQALGPQLYEIARRYVGARRRSGEALIEAGRWLTQARQLAEEGSWYLFLRVTGTSEDVAERLLNIAILAARHPSFESAIIHGQINQSVAALLARPSTPPEIIEVVLADPTPQSVAAVQRTIRAARQEGQGNHLPVDNVDNPLLAGRDIPPQLSVEEQETIAHARGIVQRLAASRALLSEADRDALLPLAQILIRLLRESLRGQP